MRWDVQPEQREDFVTAEDLDNHVGREIIDNLRNWTVSNEVDGERIKPTRTEIRQTHDAAIDGNDAPADSFQKCCNFDCLKQYSYK
jgi:hypothetical protein